MTDSEKQFVQCIRATINREPLPKMLNWPEVWKLARRHHLEVVIYEAVSSNGAIPLDIRQNMTDTYYQMVARAVKQNYCLEQIERALGEAGIHYAILKGGILKDDYPNVQERFMSDLDFYIRPEDRERIRTCMEKLGGVFRGTESGDEQFIVWKEFGVEFHGRLLYRKITSGIENYPQWTLVDEKKNRLTEEGYALNLIGHAVHDLAGAGPGIRYILDLWIYRHRHTVQPNWDAVNAWLYRDHIGDAAHNLIQLSEYLFGEEAETDLMAEMADYVVKGGLHGDFQRGFVSQAAGGNAVARQLFRNRTEFENRFPWLKKYPFLLPAAWVIRAGQSLSRHKRTIKKWQKGMKEVSAAQVRTQKERLARFGL